MHIVTASPPLLSSEPILQTDLQAIGDEGHEDMGLDALVELVVNGVDAQIAFQLLEGCSVS
jgi:hypothetical protein